MKKKINIGIIGKNFGIKVISKSFQKNKDTNVIAFSSLNEPKKEDFNNKNIIYYPNWKNLINEKFINAVVIASPPNVQAEMVEYAIKKNKHIFCEKPFTNSLSQAKKIIRILKKKRNIANIVNYLFPEIDSWKLFRKKLKNKKIVDTVKLEWRIRQKFKKKNWKFNHSKGGAVVYNFACHSVYNLEYLFGNIKILNSRISYKTPNFPYRIQAIFYFLSGIKAEMDINLLSKKKPIHFLKVKTKSSNFILINKAKNPSDRFDLEVFKQKKKITKLKTNRTLKNEDFRINPTYNNSLKFSEWILNGKKNAPNFHSAARVHYILNLLVKSSRLKRNIFCYKI